LFLVQTTAPELSSAPIVVTPRHWFSQAVPFLFFALLLVAMTKTTLLVLQRVASDSDVSRFAVALETGMLLYLIAKSTDKMFLPRLSILLERRDVAALIRMRNRRLLWVGAVCLAFLAAVVLFGRDLLALFGPGFADGYGALVIVSGATAVWTLFSLAPSYLQYVGQARFVVRATVGCVLASVVLTWELGTRYGDIGAAIAFAAPVALLYAAFAIHAWQHVMSAVEGAGPPGPPVR
jgi:O-antigen/teichoic acid export membrane protein